MKIKIYFLLLAMCALSSCLKSTRQFDATGVFVSDEIIVSSEIPGRILEMKIREGDSVFSGARVALIDTLPIQLQIDQLLASIKSLGIKTVDVKPNVKLIQDQIEVQNAQWKILENEKKRFENLVKADAATKKQLDDIVSQINILKKQIEVSQQQISVQTNATGSQNRLILSEKEPLEKRIAILNDQIHRAKIINPIAGTVLTMYAYAGEVVGAGKALYKLADLSQMNLKAYVSGAQLSTLKLGQKMKIFVDHSDKEMKEYEGILNWISDKAEFTPKTIQTKEERANLVYAIKISVINDGYLKLGMYGELQFAGLK